MEDREDNEGESEVGSAWRVGRVGRGEGRYGGKMEGKGKEAEGEREGR